MECTRNFTEYIHFIKLSNGMFFFFSCPWEHPPQHYLDSLRKKNPLFVDQEIVKVEFCCMGDAFDLDAWIIRYMSNYGIYNVRGGSFYQKNMSYDQISVLRRMIRTAQNKCYFCGEEGHKEDSCGPTNFFESGESDVSFDSEESETSSDEESEMENSEDSDMSSSEEYTSDESEELFTSTSSEEGEYSTDEDPDPSPRMRMEE